ncbi:MAG: matrixin family metalloprotease [Chitinophagaceae bacterium]|nr:matrixin family metalloprotease [Chitinophagaceae bacterium]
MFKTLLFLFFLIVACNNPSSIKKQQINITISIQPFEDVGDEAIKYVQASLKKYYPYVEVKKNIPLPNQAYYAARKRYRADSLIRFLAKQTPKGFVTIGLTTEDISTTKNSLPDWGVMGLGYQPGLACIASTYRLSKTERKVQLFKVAIHELGHTQGLVHCAEKFCYMRDAKGKNPTNEETQFCTSCSTKLKEKGWTL